MSKIRCEVLIDLVQVCDSDEEDIELFEYLKTEEGKKIEKEKLKKVWLEEIEEMIGEVDEFDLETSYTLIEDKNGDEAINPDFLLKEGTE